MQLNRPAGPPAQTPPVLAQRPQRQSRTALVVALVAALAAGGSVVADATRPATAAPNSAAARLQAAKTVAAKAKARGLRLRGTTPSGGLTVAMVDGSEPASFFNRVLHGTGGGRYAPRFLGAHRSDNDVWESDRVRVAHPSERRITGSAAGPVAAALQETTEELDDDAPVEEYYAVERGEPVRSRGVQPNGVYLVKRWLPKRGELVPDGVQALGHQHLFPVFPRVVPVEDMLAAAVQAFAGAEMLDAQRGIWEAPVRTAGRGMIVRYMTTLAADGTLVVEDMWPVYIPDAARRPLPRPAMSLTNAIWGGGGADGLIDSSRGATAVEQFVRGLSYLWARPLIPEHSTAHERALRRASQPGPAILQDDEDQVDVVTNVGSPRPARRAADPDADVRMYLVKEDPANGVRTWDAFSVGSNREEVAMGQSQTFPASMRPKALVTLINDAYEHPDHTLRLGKHREVRWTWRNDMWLQMIANTTTAELESVVPVAPSRYQGLGADWKPTL